MQQIITDFQNGTIVISDQFNVDASTYSIDATPYFPTVGDEYIISFVNLEKVLRFTKFTYDTIDLTDNRYLENYYRVSRDGYTYTDWYSLDKNITEFVPLDPAWPLFMDVKWIRAGSNTTGAIRLLEYQLEGEVERTIVEEDITVNLSAGENVILKAPYIYKVFKITDIEIISSTGVTDVDINYRYSQDSGRTWSNWEPFTVENITTVRINPIRFFQIEYSITNNSASSVKIQDINLIGDFQNVTLDYYKTNLFGIRDCCQSNVLGTYDSNGNFIPATNVSGGISGSGLDGGQCQGPGSTLPQTTTQDTANFWNPYQQSSAMALLEKLSSDAEQVFGFKVIYFLTDPDKKGQDHTIHEYQLYNVVCDGVVKVAVESNNFPDNQITMNVFDLGLFENMIVHVTKKQFKEIFGPHRRPSKEDFLYFCDVNRMFQVDHAQQFRNFNNAAIYYKLVLKKWTQKANVLADTQSINDTIRNLAKNTTLDELMGIENNQDKSAIANKDQFKPLTREPIRLEYYAEIIKELIENSSTIISKANYDLSTVDVGSEAVVYKNLKPSLLVSDNIGFQVWFKFNNYVTDDVYNFMTFYSGSLGWKSNLSNDRITITLNSTDYTWDLTGTQTNDATALEEEVWYCYVLNIDQRNRSMSQYIYKRDVDEEDEAGHLTSTVLREVYQNTQTIEPVDYDLPDSNCTILGSDMRITNIRLFVEVIPAEFHNKILNQYIIRDDSKYLVFADNATARIFLPNFPLFE
jgi:hypothetical protein